MFTVWHFKLDRFQHLPALPYIFVTFPSFSRIQVVIWVIIYRHTYIIYAHIHLYTISQGVNINKACVCRITAWISQKPHIHPLSDISTYTKLLNRTHMRENRNILHPFVELYTVHYIPGRNMIKINIKPLLVQTRVDSLTAFRAFLKTFSFCTTLMMHGRGINCTM